MDQKLIQTLLGCPLFAGFTLAELETLLNGAAYELVDYSAGDVYALEGSRCKGGDILLSGRMKAWMTGASGKEAVMDERGPGDMMAPAFIFALENRIPVTIHAVEDAKVLRIRTDELERLMDREPRLRMNFIRSISNICVFLAGKVRLLSLSRVRDKVEYLLRREYRSQGTAVIHLKQSRSAIADSFGIQKFSLIRCLNELRDEGLIAVRGKEIELLKPDYFK